MKKWCLKYFSCTDPSYEESAFDSYCVLHLSLLFELNSFINFLLESTTQEKNANEQYQYVTHA